jgi:hypothetical protein
MVILINGVSAEQILDVGSPKSWLTMSFGNGKSPPPLGCVRTALFTLQSSIIGLAVLVAICISGHVSVRTIFFQVFVS